MKYDPVPFIIEQMEEPGFRERLHKKPKGTKLGPHEDTLRQLLRDTQEVYTAALDDWEGPADPDRPSERLAENWGAENRRPEDPDEIEGWMRKHWDRDKVVHDYGDMAGEGLEDWDEHWRRHYHRGRGNPSKNRTSTRPDPPPIAPLYPVYQLVRRWWLEVLEKKKFRPDYPRDPFADGDDPRTNLLAFNPAGRFFLLIVQELDARYTARNCYGIQQTVERRRRRRNKP
jgi:hypothetical protein